MDMHINFDPVYQGDSEFVRETSKTQTALIGSIFSGELACPRLSIVGSEKRESKRKMRED